MHHVYMFTEIFIPLGKDHYSLCDNVCNLELNLSKVVFYEPSKGEHPNMLHKTQILFEKWEY